MSKITSIPVSFIWVLTYKKVFVSYIPLSYFSEENTQKIVWIV